ncbi:MAG: hypothetical protein JWP22_3942 [Ramlibacter sp.]|nr:hypothetical protein [Ramlibacter sp.]
MSFHRVETDAPSPGRRTLLAGFVGGFAASLIPWALSATSDEEQAGFLALSAILVGRDMLDAQQAQRLFAALKSDDPAFAAATRDLLAYINAHRPDPLRLQQTLDDEKSPLAALPRTIASAWWLGIVGNGDKARCLAFEKALNAQLVADVLKPPTYAYGPHGSWSRKPT